MSYNGKKVILIGIAFLLAFIAIPASAINELTISTVPFTDENTASTYGYYETSTSYSGGATSYFDNSVSIYLTKVQNFPQIYYCSMEYNGNIPEEEGYFDVWYQRPSDNTYQKGVAQITKTRNSLNQVLKTIISFYPTNWETGSKTGAYSFTLYQDSNGVKSSTTFLYFKGRYTPQTWTKTGGDEDYNGRMYCSWLQAVGDSKSHVEGYGSQYYKLNVIKEFSSLIIEIVRTKDNKSYGSTININSTSATILSDSSSIDKKFTIAEDNVKSIDVTIGEETSVYTYAISSPTPPPSGFTLTLSDTSLSAGESITGSVDTTGITYDSLHYFIDGREYITTDNPYSFIATGEVGKEYMVYVDAYYQGSFTGDSTNYIMYEITEGVSLENQYLLSLDKDIYTQGETAIGSLDDSPATDIADEIIWKVIPMQDGSGDMSTVSGFKVDYEKNGAGWTKDGIGNYTYEDAKSFSYLLDGYGNIQVEADVYNATKGLVALPYESAYVNPASWYRNAYVYLYADGGLYQGEAHITPTYILRDESTTYVTYTGYKQITVVRGGDYTIHIDLEDNSKYNDVDMVYSNYVADEKIRVYLEENYTLTEYAKLTARIVDTSGVPIYGATVKIAGSTYTSGDEGQVIYYGLDNSTVSILVSKEGYQTVEATTTLSSASNSIMITLPLISEVTVTVTPTPTATGESDSGLDTNSPFYNFYRIFMTYGLSEEMAGIAIAMSVCGVLFLLGVKFAESTSGGLAGAVVGIIFCSIAGLIPMWVIMTIILISAAVLATKMYGDGK